MRLLEMVDDGLPIPEVGSWAETKYRLVSLYDTLFSTGMKHLWSERVYIDLYAGAGYTTVRGTQRLIPGSPLLALNVPDPFDKYIFCEEDSSKLGALKTRVARHFPKANVDFLLGDCNAIVEQILASIPPHSKDHKVLSFCFVDPWGIDIKFSTIQRLSQRFVDFLVLLALFMDANRNLEHYTYVKNRKIDEFLGVDTWRETWKLEEKKGIRFPRYLAQVYASRMSTPDFLPQPLYRMKEVRSDDKNLPLYFLALFSRHQRAYDFWDQVLKYGTDQGELFS